MDSAAQQMSHKYPISILFVCFSNICRSPTLEGTLRKMAEEKNLADQLIIDSCGIGWWHIGENPDYRSAHTAADHGYPLQHKGQCFQKNFFEQFDYLLAVDSEILEILQKLTDVPKYKEKIHLATEFSPKFRGEDIPDPYYSDQSCFELVVEMSEDICRGILTRFFLSKAS